MSNQKLDHFLFDFFFYFYNNLEINFMLTF